MTQDAFRSQLTGDDTSAEPVAYPQFRSQVRQVLPEGYRESADLIETVGAIVDNDFITGTLIRDVRRLTGEGRDERDAEWDAYDNTRLEELFEEYNIPVTSRFVQNHRRTLNESHARRVLERTQRELENERTIASFFDDNNTGAFLARLGTSMFDPAGWVAGGVAGKIANTGLRADRARRIGSALDAAGELDELTGHLAVTTALTPTLTRGQYATRSALAAAAADGTLEAYHLSRSPTAGDEEIILAGLGSLAIGGAFGYINFGANQREITRRAVADFEAEAHARFFDTVQRAELTPEQLEASRQAIRESAEFQEWFEHSKVRDADGEPIVVHHGTVVDFDEFSVQPANGRATEESDAALGFFFSSRLDVAESYAFDPRSSLGRFNDFFADRFNWGHSIGHRVNPRVESVYLDIRNPFDIDFSGRAYNEAEFRDTILAAKEAGHDGVVFRGVNDDGFTDVDAASDVWVAFRPEQIKSIDNRGAFDSSDPSLRSRSPRPQPDVVRNITNDGSNDPFANSSVGAERQSTSVPEDDGLLNAQDDPLIDEFDPGQSTGFGGPVRFDAWNMFNRSMSSVVRSLGNLMFVDGAASNAARGRLQHFTVEEVASQHERIYTTNFAEATLGAYDSWKKSRGIRTVDSAFDSGHYNEFMDLAARAVRGDPTVELTPEIVQVRDAFRESMREQLYAAKKAGVLTDVDENDLYVPRFWKREAFIQMMERFESRQVGEDVLAVVIGRSLRNITDDVEKADSIARNVIRVVVDNAVSQEVLSQLSNMSPKRAREKLKGFLPDADDETLDTLVRLFGDNGRTRSPDGPRGEARLDLDENAFAVLNGVKYRVSDLFNNDLLSVNTIYSRQIGGRIGFSESTGGKLKNTEDIEAFLEKARNEVSSLSSADKEYEGKLIDQLQAYGDYLLGHGTLSEGAVPENAQAFLKFLRDVSFARLMGQVGYAQLSELGTAMGAVGFRAFISQAPKALRRVLENYTPGKSQSDDHMIGVLADMTGLANMHVLSRMRTLSRELDSEDVYGARDTTPGDRGVNGPAKTRLGQAWDTAARGAELWARGTSMIGGLQPLTDFAQYATGQALIASFIRNHKAGRALVHHRSALRAGAGPNQRRSLAMGIDEEWETRIKDMIDEVAVFNDRGILEDFQVGRATDQAAVDHLFRVVLRETRRIVQEGDLGTSQTWLVHPVLRTVFQFKTFVMNAHVKQMLYGANMRDAQLATEFLASTVMATIGQLAKYNLMTLGLAPDNRKDYLQYAYGEDENEQWLRVLASGVRYSSHVGLLPDAIDSLTQMALGERWFDYRNSGLSSGFLDFESSASWNTLTSPLRVIEELKRGEPDDAVRDAMSIGPNYVPLKILSNVLQEMAPESFEQQE